MTALSRRECRRSGDDGQAGLWSVWAAAVVLTSTVGALGWSSAVVARQRAEAAADLAALAAAAALVGSGDACGAAQRVAAAQAARVVGCDLEESAATVIVEVPVALPLLRRLDMPPARARARAGVPP